MQLNFERIVCDELLFYETADEAHKDVNEELIYNHLVQTLQPTQKWTVPEA